VGKALVMHPFTKAVGFTGSYTGGKQLYDWGTAKKRTYSRFCRNGKY
jgi:alpha-ketoglutaric semialdehyde dehydrogenase